MNSTSYAEFMGLDENHGKKYEYAQMLCDDLALVTAHACVLKVKVPLVRTLVSLVNNWNLVCSGRKYRISVYGAPSSGKSTLLNSLLGEAILPSGKSQTTGALIEFAQRRVGQGYLVIGKARGKVMEQYTAPSLEEVKAYLQKNACQNSPYDHIYIEGSFRNARGIFAKNCILQDAPGASTDETLENLSSVAAEADFHQKEKADAQMRRRVEDTEKAALALNVSDIPVFCLNVDSCGDASTYELYHKFFDKENYRLVAQPLIVVTHCDDLNEQESQRIKQYLAEKLGIEFEKVPIIQTGIVRSQASSEAKLIDVGLEGFERAIDEILDIDCAVERLYSKVSDLVRYWNSLVDWEIPVVLRKRLDVSLKRLKGIL